MNFADKMEQEFRLMGRIADFHEVITLSQLKQKLYDEWGERSTLYHSTDKIIATIKEFGVISSDKPGYYTIVKHNVTRPDVVNYMVRVAIKVDGNSYYSLTDLNAFNVLYPFEYKVSKEELMSDDNFVVTHFGGELSVAYKNSHTLS